MPREPRNAGMMWAKAQRSLHNEQFSPATRLKMKPQPCVLDTGELKTEPWRLPKLTAWRKCGKEPPGGSSGAAL